MSYLPVFGACAVAIMLLSYALEQRSAWWVLIFALACAASSLYGWLAGTWPFGDASGRVGIGRSASLVVATTTTEYTKITRQNPFISLANGIWSESWAVSIA